MHVCFIRIRFCFQTLSAFIFITLFQRMFLTLKQIPEHSRDELRSLSFRLPLPALVIASQLWEPLLVVMFCEEVQQAGVGGGDWRQRGAKTLQAAFRKAVAHSHRLLESGDEDHRRCLEILAFGGVARHKLPQRLSKPKDTSQLFAWIAKLACHGDTRSPSHKKLHTIRKLFSLMVARHPDDFGSLCDPRGWSGWKLPSDRSSFDLLRLLSPDEKGYLQSLPNFAQNWTFLSRVGATMLVGQALNDTVAAKARGGVRVRDAVLRWRADGTLQDRFERALKNLKAKHTHSHVYHVFREAVTMEGEGR